MRTRTIRSFSPIAVLGLGLVAVLAAVPASDKAGQAPRALTAADYARAEKFMSYNTAPLVLRAGVRPNWLPGDRFWYRNALEDGGGDFVLVDPKRKSRRPAFDHAAVAAALSKAAGKTFGASHLPFTSFELSADGKALTFGAEGKRWSCDLEGKACRQLESAEPAPPERRRGAGSRPGGAPPEVLSPDGRFAVFVRDHDLWAREVATKAERRLTADGVEDHGYATDNAGWTRSDRPVVLWSPDSTKIATFRQDQREVGEMYLVETKVGRPRLQAWKYPLPGDEVVSMIERVVVHLDGPRLVRLKMPPDQHRSTFSDDIKAPDGSLGDAEWSPDGRRLVFVSTSRDHKHEVVREADPETGEVRDVLEERAATYFESGSERANWRFLAASNEIVWYSERSGWAHFYLYDLATGRLKNAITAGEWPVLELLRVDEKSRRIVFLAGGRESGRDPYFRHLYSAGLDGRGIRLLTPEDADHEVGLSPSGRYFVDSYSKPDVPQAAVLRDAEGGLVLDLEKADISRLVAAGWKPPIPITVKARDGRTDLHGLMFRPTAFDPAEKYPIVNNIYPGPQAGSVRSRSFLPAHGDAQALAELGFVVVQIDGTGNPGRSKAFHDATYGNMGDNTLPDQVAGMKELARRHPWIDIDRAGIYGHSGGGFAACAAMFRYPDFFKVGVSQAGNHDNRGYEDDWGEKWQGLLARNADGTTSYDDQANQGHARDLKGKLLLAHGTMDGNVPPYLTLLVVDELIRANKDFDLIMFPNRGHGFGNEPYMVRRRWDYFVRHLLGAEPPAGYELKAPAAVAARIDRVESGLLPPFVVAGRPLPARSLDRRMAELKVPGASVAVVNDGAIEWAKGYGVTEAGTATPVTSRTLFQAASVSKPVAALAALRLVEQGRLALDEDVNAKLASWKVPENELTKSEKVTLRRLLSHTAGLTVHGFGGYAADAPVPSTLQVLDGVKPANSAAVRVDAVPGTIWRYSGGGYTVAQQLMTDVAGRPFPDLLAELVLRPLGMDDSTYEQPLPETRRGAAAAGHTSDGKLLPGRSHTYPEMAAAGLWTTPTDLARFLLEIDRARRGLSAVLSEATAREMTTAQKPGYGLGLSLSGAGPAMSFGHGGSNEGFKCQMAAFFEGGRGAVVMTNGDRGGLLAAEVLRSVAREYGWPSFKPVKKTAVAVDPQALAALEGRYELRPGRLLEVKLEGGTLFVLDGEERIELFPESETRFFDTAEGHTLVFDKGPDGRAVHMTVDGQLKAPRL